MPRFRREVEQDTGWSRDVTPRMRGYKMACCDCGLVHDMEFDVVPVLKDGPDWFEHGEPLDPATYRVVFRARRNNRSTGQMRRHMKLRQT